MLDVPTNTSATVGNYCVWNPLSTTGATCADGNLQATITVSGKWTVGTFAVSSGKYYFECVLGGATTELAIGIAPNSGTTVDSNALHYYSLDGKVYSSNSVVATGATFTSGDIIGVAFEPGGNAYFYKNNTLQATVSMPAGSDWAAEVYQTGNRSNTATVNFGQRPFSYTPPTGFVALNTYNIPTPTILQGNLYMDATTYSGTGATQVVVNQGQFKPDFIWAKSRTNTNFHNLMDSVRGTNKLLYSNSTAAEDTNAQIYTAINSNGFSVGTDNSASQSGQNFVGWQWQAGQGTTTVNTSGSISSNVSVNATAGFSIATYTGNGSAGATVGHGLGAAPKFIIIKKRSSTADWDVYHASLGATKALYLNRTDGQQTDTTFWNDTAPSSTLTTFGTSPDINSNGVTYVMYSWAEIAGFSKFGSYTGNGSADGPFQYTGFRPKFILTKKTNGAGDDWTLFDTARNTYNLATLLLRPNSTVVEQSSSIDILSNGFKWRQGGGNGNETSGTYIYMAFAENPFKSSNAR
jgi:hypothetical protein